MRSRARHDAFVYTLADDSPALSEVSRRRSVQARGSRSAWRWPGGPSLGSADERFVNLADFAVFAAAVAGWLVVTARLPLLVTLLEMLRRITTSRPRRLLKLIARACLGWHPFARGT